MLMTILSGNPPAEDRKKAAARLGSLLSPKAGRPSGDYVECTQTLKAWILENLVKERAAEMRRNGERPEGGRRTQALDEIAREYANNIDPKSLLRALARGRRLRRLLADRKKTSI